MKRGGTVMSPALKAEIEADPEYSRCALLGLQFGPCSGRTTREHSLIHAGKKIQEKWAIIPCCAAHHGVDFWQDAPTEAPKQVRVWVALNRGSDEDLYRYSKVINYQREKTRLNALYGPYEAPLIPSSPIPYQPPKMRSVRAKSGVDELEREARSYARTNGCTLDEARETIAALV